MNNALY